MFLLYRTLRLRAKRLWPMIGPNHPHHRKGGGALFHISMEKYVLKMGGGVSMQEYKTPNSF